ncbi:uncharacterized protein ACRADG_012712 [Cochliomyia hominivorax]
MQLDFILLIILFNFSKTLTHNDNNKKSADNSDLNDTPSPEWIKYQQERFQNLDKLTTTFYRNQTTNQRTLKPADVTKINSKMETTSRQDHAENKEHEEEQKEQQIECNKDKKQDCKKDQLTSTNAVEFPSIKGFIQFIKSFKENWMKNSLFRIDDKIKMLQQLKNTLLKVIEQQFMILWQDDEDEDDVDHPNESRNKRNSRKLADQKQRTHIRNKRGILDESSINFPPDAALMSINFLTFAVFLIKLVLQVVNIIKTKHYQFSTMSMMDTGAMRNG